MGKRKKKKIKKIKKIKIKIKNKKPLNRQNFITLSIFCHNSNNLFSCFSAPGSPESYNDFKEKMKKIKNSNEGTGKETHIQRRLVHRAPTIAY